MKASPVGGDNAFQTDDNVLGITQSSHEQVFGNTNLLPESFDRLAINFWKHVDRSAGPKECWPWTGCTQSKGYGVIGYKCADGVSRRFLAHRVSYMLATGQAMLPEIQVMHRCDNRPCCNSRHLFPGSQSDNMQDALSKGRMFIPGAVCPCAHGATAHGAMGCEGVTDEGLACTCKRGAA